MRGFPGSHQHRVHLHPTALQVLADGGDLVIGQVGCVLLVEFQETLQLIFGFIADVLDQEARDIDTRTFKNGNFSSLFFLQ